MNKQYKNLIRTKLEKDPYITVNQIAQELGCSTMTIRRHLTRLESEGIVERTRGGAALTHRIRLEFALYEKTNARQRQKEAIGRAAAAMVKDGERIILDTGTTTLAMAKALRGRKNISVITTSLAIVSELLRSPGIECMLLGGVVRESSPDLYGPLLEENLSRLHTDRSFVGCDALSTDGALMTTDARVARASSLMIANAEHAVLLTDSSKAGAKAFIRFADLEQFDAFVTDSEMPEAILSLAGKLGVETISASAVEETKKEELV
jgi:DeoR/GlpR family transcriptional regulator of sugar metabolism